MYQTSDWERFSPSLSGNSSSPFKVRWFTVSGTYGETDTEVLAPGGSVEAYAWDFMEQDATPANSCDQYVATSADLYTIHDPFFRCYAMSGETVPCVFNPQSCRWEVISEFGLMRFVYITPVSPSTDPIASGGNGTGYVRPSYDPWNTAHAPLEGGPEVTVVNGGVHGIQVDETGVKGLARFFQSNLTTGTDQHPLYGDSKWMIMDAECPATP